MALYLRADASLSQSLFLSKGFTYEVDCYRIEEEVLLQREKDLLLDERIRRAKESESLYRATLEEISSEGHEERLSLLKERLSDLDEKKNALLEPQHRKDRELIDALKEISREKDRVLFHKEVDAIREEIRDSYQKTWEMEELRRRQEEKDALLLEDRPLTLSSLYRSKEEIASLKEKVDRLADRLSSLTLRLLEYALLSPLIGEALKTTPSVQVFRDRSKHPLSKAICFSSFDEAVVENLKEGEILTVYLDSSKD